MTEKPKSDLERIKRAVAVLQNLRHRLHYKVERDAVILAIEHLEARRIDIEGIEADDYRRG